MRLRLPCGSASVSIRRPPALLAAVAGGTVGGGRSDRGERRGLGGDGMDRIHRGGSRLEGGSDLGALGLLRGLHMRRLGWDPKLCELALQQLLLAPAQLGHDQMAP